MPSGFLINDALHPEIRNRVAQRLRDLNFALMDWPNGSIKDSVATGDVALFVITGPACSGEELRRIQDAVNSGVPIICLYVEELLAVPEAVSDHSSSTVGLDADELGDVLNRTKSVFKSPKGEPAQKTKIKHNKC